MPPRIICTTMTDIVFWPLQLETDLEFGGILSLNGVLLEGEV
jgi:hypothetical protein